MTLGLSIRFNVHRRKLYKQLGKCDDDASLRISARGFWKKQQMAFFFITKGFLTQIAKGTRKKPFDTVIDKLKRKKRHYIKRVLLVQSRSLTPLVLSVNEKKCC